MPLLSTKPCNHTNQVPNNSVNASIVFQQNVDRSATQLSDVCFATPALLNIDDKAHPTDSAAQF
jgi:hypothetical protein